MLLVSIGAENSKLNQVVSQSQNAIANFSNKVGASFGSMLKFSTVFNVVEAGLSKLVSLAGSPFTGLKDAFDLGGSLSDLSARTGIAAGDLAVMQQAFVNAGVSEENLRNGINKLQKALVEASDGSMEQIATFDRLGLSLDELRAMSPKEQFEAVGKAINDVSDPAMRATLAMKTFGRSGAEMLTVFSDGKGGLAGAATTLGSQAEILNRQSQTFDKISDLLGSAGKKLQGFFVGLADKIGPMLLPLLEKFDKLDFASWGQGIGNAIGLAFQAFQNGQLSQLVSLALQIGFGEAVNYLVGALQALVSAFGAEFKMIFSGDFWAGLLAGLESFGAKISQILLTAFSAPIRGLQAGMQYAIEKAMEGLAAIPGLNKLLGLEGFKASSFQDTYDNTDAQLFGKSANDYGQQSADAAKRAQDLLSKPVGDFAAKLQEIMTNFQPANINDTSGMKSQIAELAAGLTKEIEASAAAAPKPPEAPPTDTSSEYDKLEQPKVIASSLAKIGGGGSAVGGFNLQREANSLLKQVVKGTQDIVKALPGSTGSSTGGAATYA